MIKKHTLINICLLGININKYFRQTRTYLTLRIFVVVVVGERRVLNPLLRLLVAPDAKEFPVDPDERLSKYHFPNEIRVTMLQQGGRSEMGLWEEMAITNNSNVAS